MMNYLVLDTETTNSIEDPICYDIGWAIIREDGEVLKTESFVVADVFINEPQLMQEAYFAEKIPQYWADIADGKRKLKRFRNIRKVLREDCVAFEIAGIVAHNARFDYRSVTLTQRWLTSSKYRYFLPYGIEILDTLKMARQVFGSMPEYLDFCAENGYLTKYGKPRFTAEIVYRFITGDNNFVESHTGLEDVLIEKDIFVKCREINSNVEMNLWKK